MSEPRPDDRPQANFDMLGGSQCAVIGTADTRVVGGDMYNTTYSYTRNVFTVPPPDRSSGSTGDTQVLSSGALSFYWSAIELRTLLQRILQSFWVNSQDPGAKDNFLLSNMGEHSNPSLPTETPGEVYVASMLHAGKGLPCWKPRPRKPIKDGEGVKLGDVGTFSVEGGFRKIFNIWDDEELIQACLSDGILYQPPPKPGPFVEPNELAKGKSVARGAWSRTIYESDNKTIARFEFRHLEPHKQGAVLAMTSAGQLEELDEDDRVELREHISRHAGLLYTYANSRRPIDSHEALYIISGCIKSETWGLAAFTDHVMDSLHVPCLVKMSDPHADEGGHTSALPTFAWRSSGTFDAYVGRSGIDGSQDQTLFLTGFKLDFSEPFRAQEKRKYPLFTGGQGPGGSKRGSFQPPDSDRRPRGGKDNDQGGGGNGRDASSPSRGFQGAGGPSDSMESNSDITISSFPDDSSSESFHPCDTINRFLLAKTGLDFSLSHDNDWIYLVGKCTISEPGIEDQQWSTVPTRLRNMDESSVLRLCGISVRHGVASLSFDEVAPGSAEEVEVLTVRLDESESPKRPDDLMAPPLRTEASTIVPSRDKAYSTSTYGALYSGLRPPGGSPVETQLERSSSPNSDKCNPEWDGSLEFLLMALLEKLMKIANHWDGSLELLLMALLEKLMEIANHWEALKEVRKMVWGDEEQPFMKLHTLRQCLEHSVRGGLRSGGLAFCIRALVNLALALLKIGNVPKMHRPALILHALFGEGTWRFGAMLGTFTSLYKFLINALPILIPASKLDGKSKAEEIPLPSMSAAEGGRRCRVSLMHRAQADLVGKRVCKWHPALAGAVAGGAAIMCEKRNRRGAICREIFVRGLQGSYNAFAAAMNFSIPYGDVIVFSLCCGQIMYGWLLRRDTLPRPYTNWITAASKTPAEAQKINYDLLQSHKYDPKDIADILRKWETTPSNQAHILDFMDRFDVLPPVPPDQAPYEFLPTALSSLKEPITTAAGKVISASDPKSWYLPYYVDCRAVHPGASSCTLTFVDKLFTVGKWILPVYGCLHFVPTIFKLDSFKKNPGKVIVKALLGSLRSSAFIGAFVALYNILFCYKHRLHRFFTILRNSHASLSKFLPQSLIDALFISKASFWLTGFGAGLSLLVEAKRRRGELAMYTLPKGMESAWLMAKGKGYGFKTGKWGDVILAAMGMGMVMSTYRHNPQHLSGPVRRILYRLVGPN